MISAVCYGCGHTVPLKIGERRFKPPSHWFKLPFRIWNGKESEVWFCSHACVFEAKRRGHTYPEPVTARDIYEIDSPEASVVSLRYSLR